MDRNFELDAAPPATATESRISTSTRTEATSWAFARRPQRTCGEKVRRRISGCAVAVAVKTDPEALQDRHHVQIVGIAVPAGRRIARLFHEALWLASMPCRFSLRKHFGRLRGDDARSPSGFTPLRRAHGNAIAANDGSRCTLLRVDIPNEVERQGAWPWQKLANADIQLVDAGQISVSQYLGGGIVASRGPSS
ncbi:uncharacterized protein TrAFT101_007857 [Trichoderma asperellum]|uniref:uncharacterized protein n=1 Tax=Trichoderma asperellum TaxID=101201 RepID=UPI0033173C0A|nr:hypothetical protein TrAFT101_007857 [Trichoderma asperellum]